MVELKFKCNTCEHKEESTAPGNTYSCSRCDRGLMIRVGICVKCKDNKSTHLEDVIGYEEEQPVCDDCFVVEFPPGFSIEWENVVGATNKDRRYCLLGAKMAVEKKKYKWGKADIVGVLITITDLDEDQVKFNVDFRVTEILKVRPDGKGNKSIERGSQETENQGRDEEPSGGGSETQGQH